MRGSIVPALAILAGVAVGSLLSVSPAHAQDLCEGVTPEPPLFFGESDADSFRSLSTGTAVTGRVTDEDRAPSDTRSSVCRDEVYYHVYTLRVQAGQNYYVIAEASFTPVIALYEWGELIPGLSTTGWLRGGQTQPLGFNASSARGFRAEKTGTALVLVTSREARQTGRYHLCVTTASSDGVYPCDKMAPTSSVEGLHVSPGFVGTWMTTEGAQQAHSTIGWGGRVGLGLGRIVLFGEYRDEIADDNAEGGAAWDGLYGLKGYDGGLRVYLGSDYGAMRPYVQGSYGLRLREAESGPDQFRGRALGGGAGVEIFLGSILTFDFGGFAARTTYDEVSPDGWDWSETDAVEWTDLRASMGMSVYLNGFFEALEY